MGALLDGAAAVDTRWLLGGLLLVVDVWAISLVVRSSAPTSEKWLWGGVIVLCPILGCIIWYVLGPKPDLLAGRGAAGKGHAADAPADRGRPRKARAADRRGGA